MGSRDAHDVHKALQVATTDPKDATVFNLSKGLLLDFTLSGGVWCSSLFFMLLGGI